MSLEHDREVSRYGMQSYNDAVSRHIPGEEAASQDVIPPSEFQAHLIPNYPTQHLLHHYSKLHNTLFTREGIRGMEVDKREWINMGLTRRAIHHELAQRGFNGAIPKAPDRFEAPFNTMQGRPSRIARDGGVIPEIVESNEVYGFSTDHGRPMGGADFH